MGKKQMGLNFCWQVYLYDSVATYYGASLRLSLVRYIVFIFCVVSFNICKQCLYVGMFVEMTGHALSDKPTWQIYKDKKLHRAKEG